MADAKAGTADLVAQIRVTNVLLVDMMQKYFQLTQNDIIDRLAKAGTPNGEIAQILGTSLNTVQVSLSRGKKKKVKK